MSGPCASCGGRHLVTVQIPGHDDIEAILCLTCTTIQPHVETANRSRSRL